MRRESRVPMRVFISSPGEVEAEREKVKRAVRSLDLTIGDSHGVAISALDWEDFTPPDRAVDPQDNINRHTRPYEIFVCITWKRMGTPTGRAVSGTAEEFDRAVEAANSGGIFPRILAYSRMSPVEPTDEVWDQLERVLDFRRTMEQANVQARRYDSVEDFYEYFRDDLYMHVTAALGLLSSEQARLSRPRRKRAPRARTATAPAATPTSSPARTPTSSGYGCAWRRS